MGKIEPKTRAGSNRCVRYKVRAKFERDTPRVYGAYKTELQASNAISDLLCKSERQLEWAQVLREETVVSREIVDTQRFERRKPLKFERYVTDDWIDTF